MSKIPITKPYIGEEELKSVQTVLESGWIVQGTKVREFERKIAEHEQVAYCCATTSCTTALQLAMLAEGMNTGKDVFVPSFTFVATANAVVSTGATPILVDVNERTYNIDVAVLEKFIKENYDWQGEKLINRISRNVVWGIVPVHQFGLCADMMALNELAHRYQLKIIEDAACALGSGIQGTHIGNFGNTACISFHPRKSITTGEGGMVLTNNQEVYQKIVELRNHGSMVDSDERHKGSGYLLPKYVISGFNYRMTDLQAAIGIVQADKLDHILERRREIAVRYDKLLKGKTPVIKTPYTPNGYYHTYQSYVCLLDFEEISIGFQKRNAIMERLDAAGIVTRQGTHAVHKQDYYRKRFRFKNNDLPVADKCDSLTISLPVFVTMTEKEQDIVADHLLKLIAEQEKK